MPVPIMSQLAGDTEGHRDGHVGLESRGVIDVVGLTARGWADLPECERRLVAAADAVVGSERQLGLVPLAPGQRRLPLPSPLRERLPGLLAELGEQRVVVLASGDPLLFGIGSTLIDMLGVEAVRVHPAVSSVALARARMGWSAEMSETVTVVGRELDLVRRRLAPGARLVILSSDASTPRAVAGLLVDAGYGPSELTVLADLGSDTESRNSGPALGWQGRAPQLNVVCVACVADRSAPLLAEVAGLPDDSYEHDGQLTKRDVRAAVLARLSPRPGERLWDLGAGAGSVAIEWCRADRRCRAVAVERDAERARRIARNAARLGVPGVVVVEGEVAAVLPDLPAADAIFIGGGGAAETVRVCWERLRPGGRLVASAVTLETEQVLLDAYSRLGGELLRISVESMGPLGRYRAWVPARPVVLWSVRMEGR
jgi:precorrin-6Y C5,15-methyltransferase (decarboxylating)